jgi:hypothetical protein
MKKLIYLACLSWAACNSESAEPLSQVDASTIFKTALLPIPHYEYGDNGDTIEVFGDELVFTFLPPDCPMVPGGCPPELFHEQFTRHFKIEWTDVGTELVMIGIFKKNISAQTVGPFINNDTDMIWTWHSGMPTGNKGNVFYEDGRSVIDGIIDYENDPAILPVSSSIYHLGIWAWNNEGTRIIYSSHPIRIQITMP